MFRSAILGVGRVSSGTTPRRVLALGRAVASTGGHYLLGVGPLQAEVAGQGLRFTTVGRTGYSSLQLAGSASSRSKKANGYPRSLLRCLSSRASAGRWSPSPAGRRPATRIQDPDDPLSVSTQPASRPGLHTKGQQVLQDVLQRLGYLLGVGTRPLSLIFPTQRQSRWAVQVGWMVLAPSCRARSPGRSRRRAPPTPLGSPASRRGRRPGA